MRAGRCGSYCWIMRTQADLASRFQEQHHGTEPLLLPSPWDPGSARLLASLGFAALGTTSSGFAASHGQVDGSVTRDAVLEHVAEIVAATDLPVSADLEDCYAEIPDAVADTVRATLPTGVAGFSIEDCTGRSGNPIHETSLAAERVRAAVEVARADPVNPVVTERAENHIRGGRG